MRNTLSDTWVKIEKEMGCELSPEMQMILCRDYIKNMFQEILIEDKLTALTRPAYAICLNDNNVLDFLFDCEFDTIMDRDDYFKLVNMILVEELDISTKQAIYSAMSEAIDAQYNLRFTQYQNRDAERDIEKLFRKLKFFA